MDNKKNLEELAKNFEVIHKKCFGKAGTSFSSSFILSLINNQNIIEVHDEQKGFCLARVTGREAEIITMAITPDFQRKGIGNSLLNKIIQSLQKSKCEKILLEVASNNIAGIKLYSKLGFKRFGIRKNYYQISKDKKVDALVMNKILIT